MTKETLAKVISEEFGDGHSMTWLIDLFISALTENEKEVVTALPSYEKQVSLVFRTLERLRTEVIKIV